MKQITDISELQKDHIYYSKGIKNTVCDQTYLKFISSKDSIYFFRIVYKKGGFGPFSVIKDIMIPIEIKDILSFIYILSSKEQNIIKLKQIQ